MKLFGDKARFAIEIAVNNLFGDAYVGEGTFRVSIKNNWYGKTDRYATVFLCICDELKKWYAAPQNAGLSLGETDKETIAHLYYAQNFSGEPIRCLDDGLLLQTKHLTEWSPESAFDDGSHLIHFDDGDATRIIGFKSRMENGRCMVTDASVEEVTVSREEFKGIVRAAYEWLQSFLTAPPEADTLLQAEQTDAERRAP